MMKLPVVKPTPPKVTAPKMLIPKPRPPKARLSPAVRAK